MPIATTFSAARQAIVDTIRGITPTYQRDSTKFWRPVHAEESIPSMDARNYYVDLGTPLEDGVVYGGCLQHTADLRVVTSYGGLGPVDEQIMPSEDLQDLWSALHSAEIDGVPRFLKVEFERIGESGRLWGAHTFSVTLFLPLPS